MKITKQEKTGNKVKLEIEVDYPTFKGAIEKTFEEAAADLAVPGFRKGMVPKNIVEQYLNKDAIVERAAQNMISDLYPEIISAAKIEPVDFPDVVILKNQEGSPFSFSLQVDVYPEVKVGKYKGIKVDKESDGVTDADLDRFISDLRERTAKFIEVSGRGIENDDLVEIDVKARSAEGDIKNLSGRKISVLVGRGQVAPGFDKELIGLNLGQPKEFKLDLPAEHPVKDVAGKAIFFEVTLQKISKKELPELSDQFAKDVSGMPTMELLKEDIKKGLSEEKKAKVEGDLKNKLIEELVAATSADIPQGMIRRETDLMIDELKASLARQRMTFENYLTMTAKSEKDIREELKVGALARVKSKLALRHVAEAEKLAVTAGDLEKELGTLSSSSGETPEKFTNAVGASGLEFIKDYLLRRKALDYIVSQAKISVKK